MLNHPTHRLFGEKDVSRILRRAAELQEKSAPDVTAGLTIEELQQIAAEAGIAPEHVAAAVADLDADAGDDDRFQFWGAPASVEFERVVPGEVTEETWDLVVSEMHRAVGAAGNVTRVGRTYEWAYTRPYSEYRVYVSATPHEGHTRLRVGYPTVDALAGTHATIDAAGLVMAILLPILANWHPALEAVLSILLFTAAFLGARKGYGAFYRARRREVRELVGRIERLVAGAEQVGSERSEHETSRTDRVLLDDTAPERAADPRSGSRRRSRS